MGMTEGTNILIYIRGWAKRLASPSIVFFLLPWLMVLLIAGTIAQKDMGIFAAQNMFFGSWILWFGPLPLPGGYLTIGTLTICLLAKFLMYSPWSISRAGTILSHLGILILLIGGILTAFSQEEGYIVLKESGQSHHVSDYHQRALFIEKNKELLVSIPFENLRPRQPVKDIKLPFPIDIQATCRNCKAFEGKNGIFLKDDPAEKEDEANIAGATLIIQNKPYIALEDMQDKRSIKIEGDEYRLYMGRSATQLPFTIKLVDFEKQMHPGTNVARAYSSQVIIDDQGVTWPYHIKMNNPLRYKGYTFYQSSFSERPDGDYSILSAVQNKGRVFPYIASAVVFLGLLFHVVLRLQSMKGRKS